MTARERRLEIRVRVRAITSRYPRPVRALGLADECALADFRAEHSALIVRERTANYCIREYGEMAR